MSGPAGYVFKDRSYVVAVGSENAAKVKAAQLVVSKLFETVSVVSAKVDSKVASQPMSDDECIRGTREARLLHSTPQKISTHLL
jgi:non-canonical (house-cleaning) NTP pyrophosphatase